MASTYITESVETSGARGGMSADRREAFLALIAPIGVDLNSVEAALARHAARVGYTTNKVRLTEIFNDISHDYDLKCDNEFQRYQKFIKAGDNLRSDSGRMDIFALYGVQKLIQHSPRGKDDEIPTEVIHIFRQLKRPEEIERLKRIFGRNILFISCYDSKENRIQNLVKKLLKTDRKRSRSDLESEAMKIMAIDEEERDHDAGQRVLDCYQHADYVIDCTSKLALANSADRFVSIYFGHPYISPNKDEYCSYHANAASYRSLDLSRQVGAAIFTEKCEVISFGCNEIPKAGGGTYWNDSPSDHRDYALGRDSNHQVREDMATDALKRLQGGWLDAKFSELNPEELSFRAFDAKGAPLKNSMMADVMEYGRMVHAEMNAITDAARSHKSVQDCNLYSTTMPCHLCTKLIVASGIKRVVYIQPYPKSLVHELYSDSVSFDQPDQKGKVSFETLKGVTPNGYRIAFRKSKKRKNPDGTTIDWDPLNAAPSFLSHYPYYRPLEITNQSELEAALKELESSIKRRKPMKSSRRTKAGKVRSEITPPTKAPDTAP